MDASTPNRAALNEILGLSYDVEPFQDDPSVFYNCIVETDSWTNRLHDAPSALDGGYISGPVPTLLRHIGSHSEVHLETREPMLLIRHAGAFETTRELDFRKVQDVKVKETYYMDGKDRKTRYTVVIEAHIGVGPNAREAVIIHINDLTSICRLYDRRNVFGVMVSEFCWSAGEEGSHRGSRSSIKTLKSFDAISERIGYSVQHDLRKDPLVWNQYFGQKFSRNVTKLYVLHLAAAIYARGDSHFDNFPVHRLAATEAGGQWWESIRNAQELDKAMRNGSFDCVNTGQMLYLIPSTEA